MKNSILVCALLLLAGGLFLFLSGRGETLPGPGEKALRNQGPQGKSGQKTVPLLREEGKREFTKRTRPPLVAQEKKAGKAHTSQRPSITVQVVDGDGRPVPGVPVGIGKTDSHFPKVKETKGPSGLAVFYELDRIFQKGKKRIKGVATLRLPLMKPVKLEFDPNAPHDKPLVLTLPPTGSVEIYVNDKSGPMKDGYAKVTLLRDLMFDSRLCKTVKQGKALFPFVGLGLKLTIFVSRAPKVFSSNSSSATLGGPGPKSPGQVVSFHVNLTSHEALLSGRILLPSGSPLANKYIDYEIIKEFNGASASHGSNLKTDKEGRFILCLRKQHPQDGTRNLELTLTNEKERETLEAEIKIPWVFPGGKLDLGDIHLKPFEPVLEGQVVDLQGKPVPGVIVGVSKKFKLSGAGDHTIWSEAGYSGTHSDGNGRFKIVGRYKDMEVKIEAQKRGWYQKEEVISRLGIKDATVVMCKGGTLTATFVLDNDITLWDIRPALVIRDSKGGMSTISPHIKRDQAYWTSLKPRNYDLEVYLHPFKSPLVSIKGIAVAPGQKVVDSRLQNINLRGRILRFKMEIFNMSGSSIDKAKILCKGPGYSDEFSYEKGDPLLLDKIRAKTLWVISEGYRPKKVTVKGSSMRVTLEKGIKIDLVYDESCDLPKAPYSLGLTLAYYGKNKNTSGFIPPSTDCRYFSREKKLCVTLSMPGKYVINWLLLKNQGNTYHYRGIRQKRASIINVKDISSTQTFMVSLQKEDLQKTMEEMEKD